MQRALVKVKDKNPEAHPQYCDSIPAEGLRQLHFCVFDFTEGLKKMQQQWQNKGLLEKNSHFNWDRTE